MYHSRIAPLTALAVTLLGASTARAAVDVQVSGLPAGPLIPGQAYRFRATVTGAEHRTQCLWE